MKSLDKIYALADKFEAKLKSFGQQAQVSQEGTTELFFGDENKQRSFANAIQNTDAKTNPVMKILNNVFSKTQAPCGFDFKITAKAGQGATFVITTTPPNIKPSVLSALNAMFKGVVGVDMAAAQANANKKAKAGSGSGTLAIGSINLD